MLSETMKKLTLLRAAMLKTRAEGLNINPPAMTRTDYDKTRGSVFGVPVNVMPHLGTSGYFRRPGYMTGDGPTRREIGLGPNTKPGVGTHELEHNLTYILGEFLPRNTKQWPGEELYTVKGGELSINPNAVKDLLGNVNPSDSELFPEWQGYKPAQRYMQTPWEFSRAAVRLYNMGSPNHRGMIAGYLPSLYEKLQLIPEDVLKLLSPHTIAGVRNYDTPGIMM